MYIDIPNSFFFNFFLSLFIFEKETEHEQERSRERGGDTESETGSRPWAVNTEPDMRLELTNREIMTWAEVRRPADWATQAPLGIPNSYLCQLHPFAYEVHLSYLMLFFFQF